MTPKVYRYRKHIGQLQYAGPFLIGAHGILLLVLGFRTISAEEPWFSMFLVVLFLVFAACAGVVWYLAYRLAGIAVSIEDDTLVYTTRAGVRRVHLEDITALAFPPVKYAGRWIKIIMPGKDIRLAVVLDDIGGFLRELKEAMDARGLDDRYDQRKFFEFLKTATSSAQSEVRSNRYTWKTVLILVLGMALAFVFMFSYESGMAGFLLALNFILSLVFVHTGAEIALGRRFARETDEERFYCPARDPDMENAVYRKATWIGIAIYVVGLMAIVLVLA